MPKATKRQATPTQVPDLCSDHLSILKTLVGMHPADRLTTPHPEAWVPMERLGLVAIWQAPDDGAWQWSVKATTAGRDFVGKVQKGKKSILPDEKSPSRPHRTAKSTPAERPSEAVSEGSP